MAFAVDKGFSLSKIGRHSKVKGERGKQILVLDFSQRYTIRDSFSKMNRKKNTICCICGIRPATSRDHIPPDGIFPDPKPTDLITVPACVKCNQGSSLNDEYFRVVIAPAYGNNDLAAQLICKNIIKRSRKKPALLQSIVKSAVKVDVHSEGGIYLGKFPAIKCDPQRVRSVIDKIVRGLFWHETNEILGTEYCVSRTVFNPELPDEAKDGIRSLPIKRVGDGKVFSYRYLLDQKDQRVSCWFLMFFDATLFIVFTEQNENELREKPGAANVF